MGVCQPGMAEDKAISNSLFLNRKSKRRAKRAGYEGVSNRVPTQSAFHLQLFRYSKAHQLTITE